MTGSQKGLSCESAWDEEGEIRTDDISKSKRNKT